MVNWRQRPIPEVSCRLEMVAAATKKKQSDDQETRAAAEDHSKRTAEANP
jgi:hypothetical protein